MAYPARGSDDDRLVPDCGAASADWDAVHLSLGGLMACDQNRRESSEGWSMHEFWHTETTSGMGELDVGYERLPDYHRGEKRPGNSGQRQPTRPPFRPPEEGAGVMLLRKYEPGEDPPDVDSLDNAFLEQAHREQVHRRTANLSRAAVKRTTVAEENCTNGGMPDGFDRSDGTAMEMVVRPALAGR